MTTQFQQLLAGVFNKEDLSQVTREIEHTHYYQLDDISQLLCASRMYEQVQWEIKFPDNPATGTKGKMRVRSEQRRGDHYIDYTACIKVFDPASRFPKEVERDINKDFFEMFSLLCTQGMRKLRCEWPIEGTEGTWPKKDNRDDEYTGGDSQGRLVYQIDLFAKDGEWVPWVKVDLEIPFENTPIPEFPLTYSRAITAPYGSRTEEEEAIVSGLYKGPFLYSHEDAKRYE